MPVNNSGNPSNIYINTSNIIRRNTNTSNQDSNSADIQQSGTTPLIGSEYYRQFGLNRNINLSSEKIPLTDDQSLREIFDLDSDAFGELDPYDSFEDFKDMLTENNMSVYTVKDSNTNKILGYYQLEPVKNGDLYIDSMGLKPEYRNTKKGYNAIQYSWNKILEYAQDNNVETLSLHVDSTNPRLVKMYKNFGFDIKETYNNYYANGAGAYFMTRPVVPQGQETTESAANQTESIVTKSQEKVLSASDKYEMAADELMQQYGVESYADAAQYLNKCILKRNKETTFNDDLFRCVKELLKLKSKINAQDDEYVKRFEINNIVDELKQKDENGNINVRTDVLPYINKMIDSGNVRPCDTVSILQASKLDTAALDFAAKVAQKRQDDAIKVCTEGSFNQDAANCYLYLQAIGLSDDDNKAVISSSYKTVDGKTVFDTNSAKKAAQYILNKDKNDLGNSPVKSSYDFSEIGKNGCPLDLYFKCYDYIKNNDSLKFMYIYKDKTAALIKAATTADKNSYDGYSWDARVIRDYKALQAEGTFSISDKSYDSQNDIYLAKVLDSCKTKPHTFQPESYDSSLVEKAKQLKQAGFDKIIPEIMELSKIRHNICKPNETVTFSNEIFNAILDFKTTNPGFGTDSLIAAINCCKDIEYNDETFNRDTFNLLKSKPLHHSSFSPNATSFVKQDAYGKHFDKELYNRYLDVQNICELSNVCDEIDRVYVPSVTKMNAVKQLAGMNYIPGWDEQGNVIDGRSLNMLAVTENSDNNEEIKRKSNISLISACKDNYSYKTKKFNPEIFNKVVCLLNKGCTGAEVYNIINNACRDYEPDSYLVNPFNEQRYQKIVEHLDNGIDTSSAVVLSRAYDNPEMFERYMTLYNKGLRGSNELGKALQGCYEKSANSCEQDVFNPLAYDRLLTAIDKGFAPEFLKSCVDDDKFSDRIFKLGVGMLDKDYSPEEIQNITKSCQEIVKDKTKKSGSRTDFNFEVFSDVDRLVELGINKENLFRVINSCKHNNNIINKDAYNKIPELHNKQFDDKGICKFLHLCLNNHEFNNDKYNRLIDLSIPHVQLRDSAHGDDYIVEKLNDYAGSINTTRDVFGEDVLGYATSLKIDGYTKFAANCTNLNNNISDSFRETLQSKLNELPSPEQKVKRLRILAGLAGKVSEENMRPLLGLIKSPNMTDEQIKLTNEIFTSDKPYSEQIEDFISEINVPQKNQEYLRNYLAEARLDKSINRPKSIEEQMAQMDVFAQQMLTNPKIPLEKKIKYIDEYKNKKADMQSNPDKYTTPTIYDKPLEGLKKVVTAYVNIPNLDTKFNNAVLESMYANLGIETTPELIENIYYDSKYFDKLFSLAEDTKPNFKRLIELVKSNPAKNLEELRLETPDAGSLNYSKFSANNLLAQINANKETNRILQEHGIDTEKWNRFDSNLNGETFSVAADAATDYKNIRFNIIDSFQDELFKKISPQETNKLQESLSKKGYSIVNNQLYRINEPIKDNEIGAFLDSIIAYTEKDDYWKSASGQGSKILSDSEKDGVNGFLDHINGFRKKVEDIKNARNVNDIHFRLSNDDDIGRNIFFGNHVGCCNSIESTYAGYSAPMHLLNNYNRGIELVDNFGNSYGNSLCFFADIDDKLAFVIDSFEANGKLGSNPVVTKHLIDFSKQVCKAMGREDAKIMIGPNYNSMSKEGLKMTSGHTVKVLGKISEKTYCDTIGGKVEPEKFEQIISGKSMYEIE